MNAKRAQHRDHVNERRTPARGITRQFEALLTELDDRNGRLSGAALMLEDPKVIAAQMERLVANLRISVISGSPAAEKLAHALGAQTIALCMSLARAEEIRIDIGLDGGEAAA